MRPAKPQIEITIVVMIDGRNEHITRRRELPDNWESLTSTQRGEYLVGVAERVRAARLTVDAKVIPAPQIVFGARPKTEDDMHDERRADEYDRLRGGT